MVRKKRKSVEKNPFILERVGHLFLLLIIIAFTLFTYYGSLSNSYTNFDDTILVFGNPNVINFQGITHLLSTFVNGMYHPVTTLFFVIEYKIFGNSAMGYHALSLIIHLVNILLVYRICMQLKPVRTIAFVASFLFALHPLHSESVYWISEQKGLLSAMFLFSAITVYLTFLKKKRWQYYALTIVLFLFSVLSKPSGIILVPVIFLLEYYIKEKVKLIDKIPFLLFSILIFIVAMRAAGSVEGINSFESYNIFDRIVLILYTPFLYLVKVFVPLFLSAKYLFPEKSGNTLPYIYLVGAFVFLALLFLFYHYRKTDKNLNFSGLYFIVTLIVFLPIISVGDSFVCERHSYIPFFGVFYFLAYLFNIVVTKYKQYNFLFLLILIFIGVGYVHISKMRAAVWKDSVALWTDIVKKNPRSSFALVNLGDSYTEIEKYDIANTHYTKAILLDSTYAHAYMNRGYVYLVTKLYDLALNDFNKAIELNPGFSKIYYNRSCVYIEKEEWQKAIDDCNKALAYKSDYSPVYYNRAVAYYNLNKYIEAKTDIDQSITIDNTSALAYLCKGKICISLNDITLAQESFNKALAIDSANTEIMYQIGMTYYKAKNYIEAEKYFSKTIKVATAFSEAYFYRAMTYEAMDNNTQALFDYDLCIRSDSTFAPAYYAKGMLLIATPKKAEACKLFEKAIEYGFASAKVPLEKYCK